MAQVKLNTIQIRSPHTSLWKTIDQNFVDHMDHICENDMIQIKDRFQIVATWFGPILNIVVNLTAM